ncbi:YgaP family membrane protein [Blastochloris sulfoviridis]|uniref:DUF2892 domain-containing protein n=1 Tax=Blastochloris sulfoviridis TaxID=50712 RepID=A0A5M6I1S1_9HYPH|nr:DUF2892 domain-containing protein [Blastochloris sulfoviridis]KAA5601827.1 DUF2892 domain-containing protein [Blastochloris sulfoviridis]
MTANVGTIDRVLRALVGIGLIYFAVTTGTIWAWIGVVPLLTALVGICPAYSMLGIKTCPTPRT